MIIIPKFISVFRKRDGSPFLETAATCLSFLHDEAGLLCALSFEKLLTDGCIVASLTSANHM